MTTATTTANLAPATTTLRAIALAALARVADPYSRGARRHRRCEVGEWIVRRYNPPYEWRYTPDYNDPSTVVVEAVVDCGECGFEPAIAVGVWSDGEGFQEIWDDEWVYDWRPPEQQTWPDLARDDEGDEGEVT